MGIITDPEYYKRCDKEAKDLSGVRDESESQSTASLAAAREIIDHLLMVEREELPRTEDVAAIIDRHVAGELAELKRTIQLYVDLKRGQETKANELYDASEKTPR